MQIDQDTIAAQVTPPGRGGVGIVRVSGLLVPIIAEQILGKIPEVNQACFCNFFDADKKVIDQGIAIRFQQPHSFTGEDVLELHGHGGIIIMDLLLHRVLQLGARLAKPGEFSLRAFLNNKIDLIEAEATADLIGAASDQAARNAVRSLQGEFSKQIHIVVAALVEIRAHLEYAIDFPEEEFGTISLNKIDRDLMHIINLLHQIQTVAFQGIVLRDGITVVICGKPNVGKSSLLNSLSGEDRAIVTEVPGTTRDILHACMQVDGMPIHLLDTAGLRDTIDLVESEGIKRAWAEISHADHILLVVDAKDDQSRDPAKLWSELFSSLPKKANFSVIYNKIDLTHEPAQIVANNEICCIYLSIKTGAGMDLLKQHLKESAGFKNIEGGFSARRRHLEALKRATAYLEKAHQALRLGSMVEITADDLNRAHRALGEITGEFTTDDLLEKIFSEFCVGK